MKDNNVIGDLRERLGILQGEVKSWMDSDREQHKTIFGYIEDIKNHINNVEINISEIKADISTLKNNVLNMLQKGFWVRFFEFAQTPKGSLAIIIIIVVCAAFYLGIDKVISLMEVLMRR